MGRSRNYIGDATAPVDIQDFYFVRHAQTDLNTIVTIEDGEKKWLAQGAGTDAELNETGRGQASIAGQILRNLGIQSVISSPMIRALQTVALFDLQLPVAVDDNLKERHFGPYEGKLAPEWMFEDNCTGWEDTVVFSRRVAEALRHAHNGGTLLVSHGGVLSVIAALLGVCLNEDDLRNACVVLFERNDSGWSVVNLSQSQL